MRTKNLAKGGFVAYDKVYPEEYRLYRRSDRRFGKRTYYGSMYEVHRVATMIDKNQLRDLIGRVLKEADLYSDSAVELLMLTAAVESKLGTYIKQVRGPALGIFQMEPATHDDIWNNFIDYKKDLGPRLSDIANSEEDYASLEWNLAYSVLMTRIHYLRVPSKLPPADDVVAMANYWKTTYNTYLGKGTVEKAIKAYNSYCV